MKNSNIMLVIVVAISSAIGANFGGYFYDQIVNPAPEFDKVLMQVAENINKSCPMMVDSETRLDNVSAFGHNSVQYNYTLVNYSKEQINIPDFKKKIMPVILNGIKTSESMKTFRDRNVTMEYRYKDQSGVEILTFEFTSSDYK